MNDIIAEEFSMSLYPNPAKDKTTLTINGLDKEATMTISDELGRTIQKQLLQQMRQARLSTQAILQVEFITLK